MCRDLPRLSCGEMTLCFFEASSITVGWRMWLFDVLSESLKDGLIAAESTLSVFRDLSCIIDEQLTFGLEEECTLEESRLPMCRDLPRLSCGEMTLCFFEASSITVGWRMWLFDVLSESLKDGLIAAGSTLPIFRDLRCTIDEPLALGLEEKCVLEESRLTIFRDLPCLGCAEIALCFPEARFKTLRLEIRFFLGRPLFLFIHLWPVASSDLVWVSINVFDKDLFVSIEHFCFFSVIPSLSEVLCVPSLFDVFLKRLERLFLEEFKVSVFELTPVERWIKFSSNFS